MLAWLEFPVFVNILNNIIYYCADSRMLTLNLSNVKRKAIQTTCITGSVATTAILLTAILVPTYQASAQITASSPQSSLLPKNLQSAGGGLLPHDPVNLVQNSTTTNITQLARVLPTVDQPITPPLIAVDEEPDEGSDSNDDDTDDQDDENNSSRNDNDDDDNSGDDADGRNDDNDGDAGERGGGGRGAFAASGGAFAIAG
jgi:hypothetical protein